MKNSKNVFLVVISIIALLVFSTETIITIYSQAADSQEQIEELLITTAEKEAEVLNTKLMEIGKNALVLAMLIGSDDQLEENLYIEFIAKALADNNMLFGMGYWFEPFVVDEKYYGPYFYKDNDGNMVKTMAYSNEAYDYFSWDWYINGLNAEGDYQFTEPFYDEYLNTFFMTIASPIEKRDGLIGVVSADVTLREINEYVRNIDLGEAVVLIEDGTILYDQDLDNALDSDNLSDELSVVSKEILAGDKISGTKDLDEYIYAWAPIGDTHMRLVIEMSKDKIFQSIYVRVIVSVITYIIALVLFILVLNNGLKRLVEKPLKSLLSRNINRSDESVLTQEKVENKAPNMNNLVLMIDQLFEERNANIKLLKEQNDELEIKNEEVEELYQQTTEMNYQLNLLLEEIRNGYLVTVKSLSNAIEAKDSYTKGHCESVTRYALDLAEEFQVSEEDMVNLEYASLLHDVGKIGIPVSILNKPGRLTDEEYKIIMQHPEIGYDMIKDIDFLGKSIDIVRHHHERVDGKGYPLGLKGHEIDLLTKILTVVDAYDAMTSKRPYRQNPLSHEEAVKILLNNKGTQFDAEVVDTFVRMSGH